MNENTRNQTFGILLFGAAAACGEAAAEPAWVEVSGTGTHYFSTALVHSTSEEAGVTLQRSTDTVELEGDLRGRVLYHPVTRIDPVAGTLVNTGHQVFSGTVLGSEPVLVADQSFRFEVQLATGHTTGRVHLETLLAGPEVECELDIDDAGQRAENGDATFRYTGRCRF